MERAEKRNAISVIMFVSCLHLIAHMLTPSKYGLIKVLMVRTKQI